jgi:lysophospholipase L1-like esterase
MSGFAADSGKIIAVFGDAAASKVLPPGWNFYWNANGRPGESKGYAPLTYNAKSKMYGVTGKDGALMPDRPGCGQYYSAYSGRDKERVARFLIASYTMQNDSAGDVWVNNGNIRNKSFPEGNIVEIYLNDELKFKELIKKDRFAQVFREKLGRLKKGDSISVALGPGDKSPKAGGKFNFTIEEYPAGQNPGEPVNVISPPITSVAPQMGADGKIDRGYSDKHKTQCAEFLAKKSELVFLGDSITARWPAELLQSRFGKYRPVNLGIGGDWIQNVIWRIENGVFDQVKPKLVVLLIGTNNISGGFTPDEISSGIDSIIWALNKKTPETKILVLGIFPRGKSINNNPAYEDIKKINASISKIADGKKTIYIDFGDKLLEKDGSLSKSVFPDRLHIAAKAYEVWADAVAPLVNKMTEE